MMMTMHFNIFISVLSLMYRLCIYIFLFCSAWMALLTVLYVDYYAVAIVLMIMTLLAFHRAWGITCPPSFDVPSTLILLRLSLGFSYLQVILELKVKPKS